MDIETAKRLMREAMDLQYHQCVDATAALREVGMPEEWQAPFVCALVSGFIELVDWCGWVEPA